MLIIPRNSCVVKRCSRNFQNGGITMNKNEPAATIEAATIAEAAKEAERAYHREWRKNNPEKVKANRKRYWEKKAAAMKAATTLIL